MKIERVLSMVAAVSFLLVAGPGSASAGDSSNGPTCPPPLMVCQNSSSTEDGCPRGYNCACVPSCPNCRDCAARVCVAGEDDPECRTACDCDPSLGCFDNRCIAGFAPVFCCDSDQCPAGEQCQHKDGRMDRCRPEPECRTACDCEPGTPCFNGHCIPAAIAVYCCDSDACPGGNACQTRTGRMSRCGGEPECKTACDCEPGQGCFDGRCTSTNVPIYCCDDERCEPGFPCQLRNGRPSYCKVPTCVDQTWNCDAAGSASACGDGRICACTASCPFCEDCGPPVCVPPNLPSNPYRCNEDGGCSRPGDRCVCVSSCPDCDDCPRSVCVPSCDEPEDKCQQRMERTYELTRKIVERSRRCVSDEDCRHVDTNTECFGTCGAFVNKKRAPLVGRAMRYIDHKYCGSYQDDGCPYVTPGCLAQQPVCVDGACTGDVSATQGEE